MLFETFHDSGRHYARFPDGSTTEEFKNEIELVSELQRRGHYLKRMTYENVPIANARKFECRTKWFEGEKENDPIKRLFNK